MVIGNPFVDVLRVGDVFGASKRQTIVTLFGFNFVGGGLPLNKLSILQLVSINF